MTDSALAAAATPFTVRPHLQPRAWGGSRFQRPDGQAVGEAWLVDDRCEVSEGPNAGRHLADLTRELGAALVGSAVDDRWSGHFPLRIKILDAADWLSVQVHPDTAVARRRHGRDAVGKEEAWFVLESPPGAELVAGLRPGTTAAALEAAFATPRIADLLVRLEVHAGDTITVPAGLVHSIAPGVCVYEIQEPSDLTYRMYDWERPASLGRELDRDASLEAIRLEARPRIVRAADASATAPVSVLARTDAFVLRRVSPTPDRSLTIDVAPESVLVLTAVDRPAAVEWSGQSEASSRWTLRRNESLVVPAGRAQVVISAPEPATVLVGSVV